MHKISGKLLIIDDDEVVRESLAAYLEDSDFDILQAANGQQGLSVFEQEQPDLVICDLRMPQVDGLTLIRRIREELHSETPIIVLSGAGVIGDVVEALRLGASDYLIKPLEELAVLEHSVVRALERSQLAIENERYREKLEAANQELQASLHLLQEDQDAGRQVQMNMLPETPAQYGDLTFAHRIIPSLYLSGDFVDYFHVDDQHVAFYLADVSGHGASSAFVTGMLKFITTRQLYECRSQGTLDQFTPVQVMDYINHYLLNFKLGKHVTMVFGIIDLQRNQLTYSVGGHIPLPVLCMDGKTQYLEGQGLPVGLFEDAKYDARSIELPSRFSLSLFSDGIFDVLSGEGIKDKEAVLLQEVRTAGGTLNGLVQTLRLDQLKDMPDDIALMVLSR